MKKCLFILLALFALNAMLFAEGQQEGTVKIGFLVKQPEESWFQDEWKFAQQAADQYGFELIKIGTTDGEKVLSAIDNLAAQGAKGFVICTPDVKLGPAIVAKAQQQGLKVHSVDDRFVGPDGNPMQDVVHMGISAYNIGKFVGTIISDEIKARGWDISKVGYLRMSFDQLPTIKERTDGATEILTAAGLPAANIYDSPMKTLDTEGSFNAANITITKHPEIKQWIVSGGNDSSVIGAIRALEGNGFGAADAIGVGINGSNFAINEFEKSDVNAFFASVKLSAKMHGFGTAEAMYKWITEGTEPPKVTWTSGALLNRGNYKTLE